MDPQLWIQVLPHTFSPHSYERLHAQEVLQQYCREQHGMSALLQVLTVDEPGFREVRLAAALTFKNNFGKIFLETESHIPVSPEEKAHLMQTLLELLMVEQDKPIRDTLAEAVRICADTEFPHNWPALVPFVMSQMQIDSLRLHNSLLVIRVLCKRYEMKSRENRGPLNELVRDVFPVLQQLLQHVLEQNTLEAANIIKLILKSFWSATQYMLPETLPGAVNLDQFFEMIAFLLNKRLPEAHENIEPLGQPVDPDERPSWPWWKVKKWAFQIIARFASRYGNPQYTTSEYQEFAQHFRNNYAPMFVPPAMTAVAARSKGEFVTKRVLYLALQYLASATELSPSYKLIKRDLMSLLQYGIFPVLCSTDHDLYLIENDPEEYLRQEGAIENDFMDPRMAALSLLETLVKTRGKDTLAPLLGFLNHLLEEYRNAPFEARDWKAKEGALYATGALSEVLMEKSAYRTQLEGFLLQHVLPEFQSPNPIMRVRACWAVARFAEIEFSTPESIHAILEAVLQALRDTCVPVQVSASVALQWLSRVEEAKPTIVQYLPQIVDEYFRILSQSQADEVVGALQELVANFPEHVAPHAVAVVQRLVEVFVHLMSAGGEEADDNSFLAINSLGTISVVLDATQHCPEVLPELETIIVPVLGQLLLNENDDCFDFIDDICVIMSYLTYYPEQVSPQVWALLGPLVNALDEYAYDYLNAMMPSLFNYVSKDPQQFLAYAIGDVPAVARLLQIAKKTVENDAHLEHDARAALRLIGIIVQSCQGAIDMYIPGIVQLLMEKSAQISKELTLLTVLNVVMSLIHYNPMLTVQSFGPAMPMVFQTLVNHLQLLDSDLSQRLIVLSLSSLFLVPTDQLPEVIRANITSMVQSVVRELTLIAEDQERGSDDDADGEGGDDEEDEDEIDALLNKVENAGRHDDDEDSGADEDDDPVIPEDQTYMDALNKAIDSARVKRVMGGELMDEDDDDYTSDMVSPVQTIDCFDFFFSALHQAAGREPQVYGDIVQSLAPEDQARFQALLDRVNAAAST